MNWLLIVVGVIFLIGIVAGLIKGGVRIAVSLGVTLLTLLLVFMVTPFVNKAIYNYTPMDEAVEEKLLSTMTAMVTTSTLRELGIDEEDVRAKLKEYGVSERALAQAGVTIEEIMEGTADGRVLEKNGIPSDILNFQATIEPEEGEGETTEEGEAPAESETAEDAEKETPMLIPRNAQMAVIQSADVPEVLKDLLKENNNSEIYKTLGVATFPEYIAKYLAKLTINMIAFFATFVVLTIIIRSIVFALDVVSDLPGLGAINRLAGMVIGAAIAVLVVNVLFVGITILFQTTFGKNMFDLIAESPALTFLYDHNFILRLSTMFR